MDVRHRLAIFASMFAVAACAAPAASGADQSSWPAAQRASATSSTASGDRQAADSENHMCPGRDNPHKSTHVPGTINVIVNVTCTEPVTQITIRGGFYYNGALTYVGPSKSFSARLLPQRTQPCHVNPAITKAISRTASSSHRATSHQRVEARAPTTRT